MTATLPESTESEFLLKVREILESVSICLLCTHGEAGRIEARPMSLQAIDFHGNLWFFCGKNSPKAKQIEVDSVVTVTAENTDSKQCVVLRGKGRIVDDFARMEQLWKPEQAKWFPGGVEDPNLTLLRVEVKEAEYWEWPSGLVAQTLHRIEEMMTGIEAPLTTHERKQL